MKPPIVELTLPIAFYRLLTAMLCGFVIGYGRSRKARDAVLPTYMLVTVGAAMQKPLPALLFFCCQLFGCLFAVIKPVSAPPTRLLHDQN